MTKELTRKLIVQALSSSLILLSNQLQAETTEQVDVVGDQLFTDTTIVSPTSKITAEDLEGINFMNSEDAIVYEPNVVVRKRYIGDSNGSLGIRGSNMFQTSRTSVFADGLPLHYHLETRWLGAPRWSLIGPDEIEEVEVIYGPFSAEYSGNAMGGVVNITTRDPQEERVVLEGTLFSQQYDKFGTDESFNGGKLYTAYENRYGNLGVFASFTHLKNESQPMDLFASTTTDSTTATATAGAYVGTDNYGADTIYFGDSGPDQVTTDLLKLKLTYDAGNYDLRGSIAYEMRDRELNQHSNYLVDNLGNTIWDEFVSTNEGDVTTYQYGTSLFQERYNERETLLLGAGISGPLSNDWVFDIYATHFDVIKDEEKRTGANPDDPLYATVNASDDARFKEYNDTGWKTLDFQTGTESLMDDDTQRLSLGVHYSNYTMSVNEDNYNFITNTSGSDKTNFGGETTLTGIYGQWGWAFDPKWDLSLGLRYEKWKTKDGFKEAFGWGGGSATHPNRSESGLSPKFSIANFVNDDLSVRYSLAKAYRFPLVHELFDSSFEDSEGVTGDPTLDPEVGIHHSISIEQQIPRGYVRVNLFKDIIDDVIFYHEASPEGLGDNVETFLPVAEVTTQGIEFIFNQTQVMDTRADVRFNVSYTDAETTKDELLSTDELVGKDFPRIPHWRANLLLGYNVSPKLDANIGIRYASNSYGDLDNTDTANNVYRAHDAYTFVNARANYQVSKEATVSVGIDNIFDEEAYVSHPWPSRTFFVEGKLVY